MWTRRILVLTLITILLLSVIPGVTLAKEKPNDFKPVPAEDGELAVYEHKGDWACMDTFRDMQFLNEFRREGRAFWKIWDE